MKTVLQHIFRHKRAYSELPFFDFLRDDSLTVSRRLGFFPCMASFIMAFGDLNRYVLRVEPTDDPLQRMVNEHTYEDDHHWPWFLEDFVKLGHDTSLPANRFWRQQFGDATVENRLLAHRLAHLVWSASPKLRLVIIEAIEETGNVLFRLTSALAAQYQLETGTELRYCGEFHFQLESGHAMNNDHAALAALSLDDQERTRALELVDEVFTAFERWTNELLRFALEVPAEASTVS